MNYWAPTIFAATVIALSVSGCANKLKVTYDSDPRGAALYSGRNQQRFGYTPKTISYRVSKKDQKRGYMILAHTSVRWASGAVAEMTSLRVDLNQHGLTRQFTFKRPEGVPGRGDDMRFALELEKLGVMRRQAEAQEAQALSQSINAINQQYHQQWQREQEYNRQQHTTSCTSRLSGNIINTTCR